ncbi:MAG: ice-binding family protein [Planctomycetota bacterium]
MLKYLSSLVFLVGLSIAFAASGADSQPVPEPQGLPFSIPGAGTRAAAASTLSYTFSTVMKNPGVLAKAAGKISGKFTRVGSVRSQQLSISLTNLLPGTTYQLAAFIGSVTSSANVGTFISDAKGKYKVAYSQKDGSTSKSAKPLPDALNPLSMVRELDIVAAGQTLLSAVVIPADKFQYQYKGPLANPGAISGAAGTLQLKATQNAKSSQFGLKVSGLPPATAFILSINGSVNQTLKSDSKGKLNVKTLPGDSPNVLDIHTVALINNASGSVVVLMNGLGIPPAAPTVIATSPVNAAAGVPTNAKLSVTFSEAVVPTTITASNFTVTGPGTTPVAGTVSYDAPSNIAVFTPAATLAPGTLFSATLAAGVLDLSGNTLASNVAWSFTTSVASDTSAPFVTSTYPANGAASAPINFPITATFNKAMDPLTITPTTFTLAQGTTPVTGTVSYAGTTATFTPAGNLVVNTSYTATITTGAADLAGIDLASPFTWSFTTGAAAAGPAPVVLGATNTFAVLSGYAVTNIPSSVITGDVGISPAAESFITGFSQTDATGYATSPQVTGKIYAADMAAPTPDMLTQAKNDLTMAYNDAAGRTTGTVLNPGAGDLAGLSLVPGLYKFTSAAQATTNFTLTGGPNDVWIFQIATTLTISNGVQVTLAGGAKASNIFWQVGTQATLGTTVAFYGTIMADASITMQTGATLNGRALAFSGTIALAQNAITIPAP